MTIAILSTPTSTVIELTFREEVVVGHRGDFLYFWRHDAYLAKACRGFIVGGTLAARVLAMPPKQTFDDKAAEVMARYGRGTADVWRSHRGVWVDVGDGLGPCIILLLEVTTELALQLEYAIDPVDPAPWAPFADDTLLASIQRVVARPGLGACDECAESKV